MSERWEPGDIALAADGVLWQRYSTDPADVAEGLVWTDAIGYGSPVPDTVPERPLTLIVRRGRPMVTGPCHDVLGPIFPGTSPLSCVLTAGHRGAHKSIEGTTWSPKPSSPTRMGS